MKRSEAYRAAQIAVMTSVMSVHEKIEVMKVLIEAEELALFQEVRQEAELALGTKGGEKE